MARKMDAHASDIALFNRNQADISKFEKQARDLRKVQATLEAKILKSMGTSTEATIGGRKVFEVVEASRESVTIASVEKHAPQLRDVLVTKSTKRKIKFTNG